MTNEEITVKYYTSIRNTDAADRMWSPGDAEFAPGPAERGWAEGKENLWMGQRISDRSLGCRREGEKVGTGLGPSQRGGDGAGPHSSVGTPWGSLGVSVGLCGLLWISRAPVLGKGLLSQRKIVYKNAGEGSWCCLTAAARTARLQPGQRWVLGAFSGCLWESRA